MLVIQLCLTLCKPMGYTLSGFSVHGSLQVRILEWVANPFSRGSSWPRDRTWVSCIASRFFTIWATRETLVDYDISIVLQFFTCLLILFLHGFFFSFFFSFISWRLITLQYCSGFCHTLTWISHGFTCIPHPDPPTHLPLYPIPLALPSAAGPSTCLMHPTWAGDPFHHR